MKLSPELVAELSESLLASVFKIQVEDEMKMHALGILLGRKLEPGDLVSLNGPLGAGKTTLTRGIGEGVKAQGNVSSPTFLIARTHPTEQGIDFVHIDAYRLSSPAELDDLDINFANSISVIEWGDGYTEGLTDSLLVVDIERFPDTETREILFTGSGRFENLAQLEKELK
jgi:tRNA threonylcarbamoyladenosine biosynthesis protein TsaE